ncbi:MAG: hypothetical protein JRJ15_02155 [Deltaproteobacteria bacterium]|nr:hypothetical protein [Deltaproteobacteria bacterium]
MNTRWQKDKEMLAAWADMKGFGQQEAKKTGGQVSIVDSSPMQATSLIGGLA